MQATEPTVITRVLNAPRARVWQVWTAPEEIKKWWGPKNFSAPEIKVDFRVGGKYIYCMRGSAGPGQEAQDFWNAGEFIEIVPEQKIVVVDYFSDSEGNQVSPATYGMPEMPEAMHRSVTFTDEPDGKTKLTLTYTDQFPKEDKFNMITGWQQSLDKLEASL